MPPIPLNAQPSVNIPPSTNRNLRNIQLADLDHMADEIPDDIGKWFQMKHFCMKKLYLNRKFYWYKILENTVL